MIVGLFITIIILSILLWGTLMFTWWQKETGAPEVPVTNTVGTYWDKSARLARRGWYICAMQIELLRIWSKKKIAKLFFSLFPNARPAFTEKDELTGLSHGPSSFFLKSISETTKEEKRKPSSRKKIV